MDTIPLKPERRAELEEYAQRHGRDPATALDDALGAYLAWEREDSEEASEGIRRGHEDVRAGRTRPAAEFLSELRRKHDLRHRMSAQAESDAEAILDWLLSQTCRRDHAQAEQFRVKRS